MNVLIADSFPDRGIENIKATGCHVIYEPSLKEDTLEEAIARTECRVLVVRSTRVTAPMFEVGKVLSLIVRAGAGVNTIDVQAASRRGVMVANCPGKNAVAVAELTFALILSLDRRVVDGTNDLRQGVWNKKEYTNSRGLKGATLGIIGMGRIGQAVAQRARGFEMRVVAWSRSLTDEMAEAYEVERMPSMEAVAGECDMLSIHLASTPDTQQCIGRNVFEALKPGAIFVNTARGEVVDHAALTNAIETKSVRAGLDAFTDEPKTGTGDFTDAIIKAKGCVYGTHHIGASTEQAQDAIADETVRIIETYKNTSRVENCVNLCARSTATNVLMVRHLNKPGVLAHTLSAIRQAGVNVLEMENIIFQGDQAACAAIKLSAPLDDDVVRQIQKCDEHIIGVSVSRLAP